MSTTQPLNENPRQIRRPGWKDIYLKEDWWAVWIGVGLMIIAVMLFRDGNTVFKSLAVNPALWKRTAE